MITLVGMYLSIYLSACRFFLIDYKANRMNRQHHHIRRDTHRASVRRRAPEIA